MSLGPLRLLVIEDTPDDADLLALELRRAGYQVTMRRVQDLPAMGDALDGAEWDLIVSDHSMPGMTSFDALDILRKRELDLPFIIVSGGIGEEEAVAAMRAGAKDYVIKGNTARLIPAVARELHQADLRRERRKAETALREQEQMREFALTSANVAEWEMELGSLAFRPTVQHLRLLGVAEEPSPWSFRRFLACVVADDRPRVEHAFRTAAARGTDLDLEFRVASPDRGVRWLWSRSRNFQPEGRPPVRAGIIADISARKETEAQLQQALKMEAIGQLTGGIAHDFNNLLTVIMGNSGLLREELAANGELAELVESIQGAGRTGAELTKRLLAFARQQPLEVREIDLAQRLKEASGMLRHPLGPGIELRFDIDPNLPPVAIDPNQLETAILNLVINSRDAMPDGGIITISAKTIPAADPEIETDMILLAVADNGSGMPPEVAARALEPFFTTKEIGKGTGLGLSMVYGFVRQSAGKIAIESAPGAGTTVKICLPGARMAKREDAPSPLKLLKQAARATSILVVDDDRAVRGFLVAVCRGRGHRVIEAANGTEALAALEKAPQIELLFSDVAMPNGMTGYELAREARSRRPDLKVLLTSGFPAKDVMQRGALDPDIRVLQKPYDPAELAAAITDVLGDG